MDKQVTGKYLTDESDSFAGSVLASGSKGGDLSSEPIRSCLGVSWVAACMGVCIVHWSSAVHCRK